jgi:hypothetical protein
MFLNYFHARSRCTGRQNRLFDAVFRHNFVSHLKFPLTLTHSTIPKICYRRNVILLDLSRRMVCGTEVGLTCLGSWILLDQIEIQPLVFLIIVQFPDLPAGDWFNSCLTPVSLGSNSVT